MDLSALLTELSSVPRLAGAACRTPEHRVLFDAVSTVEARRGRRPQAVTDAALAVCGGCAALAQCRRWVLGLAPGERPEGVVGGMVIPASRSAARSGRRRKSA